MIEVVFFASLREQLGVANTTMPFEEGLTVAVLRSRMIAEQGQAWAQALAADNIITAVNHEVVDDRWTLQDGDELAFFPPVTGG